MASCVPGEWWPAVSLSLGPTLRVPVGPERRAGGICLGSAFPSASYFIRCVVPPGNLALRA